ncbi:MAG: PilZ domain-containing protein [Thermodesulfobacteriota bacterium]|nr:PilZ domain-containing protein [Thermodesulfobacteriota bacterium]
METRRKRSRVSGHFEAAVVFEGETIPVLTEDISLKGVFCTAEQDLERMKGKLCILALTLAGDIGLEIRSEVVRVSGREAALDFLEMDQESYTHLRNIVRFSAQDPDAIDMEQFTPAFKK